MEMVDFHQEASPLLHHARACLTPPAAPQPFSACAAFCTIFSAIAVVVLAILGWLFIQQPEFIPEVHHSEADGMGLQLWFAALVYLGFAFYCFPRIGGKQ